MAATPPKSERRYRTRRIPGIFYVAGTMAITGGLLVTDQIYGHKLIAKYDPPLVTVDTKFCKTETCTNTARTLVSATALWTQTIKGMEGYTAHPFLNARFVIGSAGIESDMGASLHTKGSRYEGPLQLSRRIDDTHFTDISAQLFETIKAAYLKNPDAIPALNAIKLFAKDKTTKKMTLQQITPQQLQEIFADPITWVVLPKSETRAEPLRYATNKFLRLLRNDVALFRDPTIQTFAFLEASHKALKGFTALPHFMELPEHEKHEIMYAAHNHPRMSRVTLQQQLCELPVRVLSPRDVRYFEGNSGIYHRDGDATPAQVKYRIGIRMYKYVNWHGPKTGDATLATSVRPVEPRLYGQSSLVGRFVGRQMNNRLHCFPTKT
ncbi:MAG: hypothetical protein K2Q32_00560 [Alphaproteobacteria bacterium]|nr:hypothetical protein [Alphaproteobacteria bacterium]